MSASRAPESRGPARIAPLATLPLFHKLGGRKVVLAGDSDGALWKAELLAAAGSDLLVFAPERPEVFAALAEHPPAGSVTIIPRGWEPADLAGARFAVADVETDAEAERFVAAARAAGAVVNVVDKPPFCDVQFGALVNRSPLVVAISTDGAAPVFGQAVRAKIESVLPTGLKGWAEAARDWRPFVQARGLAFAARRAFWERFTRTALEAPERAPTDADRDALLATLDRIEAEPAAGRVTLVGAGPGDPELLTLKAVRALQSADIILYDDLVSDGVLELAGARRGGCSSARPGTAPPASSPTSTTAREAGAAGASCGAAQERRSARVRPRNGGDRGLRKGRHPGRHRARRDLGAGSGGGARDFAHGAEQGAPCAVPDGSRGGWTPAAGHRLGSGRRSGRDHDPLHAGADPGGIPRPGARRRARSGDARGGREERHAALVHACLEHDHELARIAVQLADAGAGARDDRARPQTKIGRGRPRVGRGLKAENVLL